MIVNVFYRQEQSILDCPKCRKPLQLRYAIDPAATAERTRTMQRQGFTRPDQLQVYSTTPYLMLCTNCSFQLVLARARRRKLNPQPTAPGGQQ